jgi:hypothetical protein
MTTTRIALRMASPEKIYPKTYTMTRPNQLQCHLVDVGLPFFGKAFLYGWAGDFCLDGVDYGQAKALRIQ